MRVGYTMTFVSVCADSELRGQSSWLADASCRKEKGFGGRPVHANHPQRSPEIARTRSGPSHLQPAEIFFMRQVGIHKNVAIAILGTRSAHRDFLMPAVLSADRVGLDGEG